MRIPLLRIAIAICALSVSAFAVEKDRGAWVEEAAKKAPMTVEETRAFMKRLTQYVLEHHLKRDEASAQRGMIYEYFRTSLKGQPGQWIEGEGLDTMHDGSWFGLAMVNASKA